MQLIHEILKDESYKNLIIIFNFICGFTLVNQKENFINVGVEDAHS